MNIETPVSHRSVTLQALGIQQRTDKNHGAEILQEGDRHGAFMELRFYKRETD